MPDAVIQRERLFNLANGPTGQRSYLVYGSALFDGAAEFSMGHMIVDHLFMDGVAVGDGAGFGESPKTIPMAQGVKERQRFKTIQKAKQLNNVELPFIVRIQLCVKGTGGDSNVIGKLPYRYGTLVMGYFMKSPQNRCRSL
jgi:hypothetical protein